MLVSKCSLHYIAWCRDAAKNCSMVNWSTSVHLVGRKVVQAQTDTDAMHVLSHACIELLFMKIGPLMPTTVGCKL